MTIVSSFDAMRKQTFEEKERLIVQALRKHLKLSDDQELDVYGLRDRLATLVYPDRYKETFCCDGVHLITFDKTPPKIDSEPLAFYKYEIHV